MVKQSTRLVVALLIGASGFVTIVAAVGAGEEVNGPSVPEDFVVPRPVPGDLGRYDFVHILDTPEGPVQVGQPLPYLDFRYEAQSGFLDKNGTARAILIEYAREAQYHDWRGSGPFDWEFWDVDVHYSDLLTHDTVAWEHGFPHSGAALEDEGIILPGGDGRSISDNFVFRMYHDWTHRVSTNCLLEHRLHRVPMDETVELFRWCGMVQYRVDPTDPNGKTKDELEALQWPNESFFEENATFQLVAIRTWNDLPAVVYRQDPYELNWTEPAPRLDVWFADGVPFPVRVQQIEPDADGLRRVWTLSEFTPGQPVSLPAGQDAPELQFTAAHPWGPDATGWDRFDPAEAWQAAIDDGRIMMALEPEGAYRAISQYTTWRNADEGTYEETWTFVIHTSAQLAGEGMPAYEVTRTQQEPAFLVPYGLVDSGVVDDPGSIDVEMRQWLSSYQDDGPAQRVPTLTSAVARYEAYSHLDPGSPNYDISNLRFDGQGGPNGGVSINALERIHSAHVEGTSVVEREGFDHAFVSFNDDGLIGAFLSSDHTRETGVVGLAADSPSATAATPVPSPPTKLDWARPSTATLAGAGALSLTAAAIYYFWPALKSGAVGMFSRIREDDVLDHPVRRQIYDAIVENPGIHTQAVLRHVGTGFGNTQHHLDKLLDTGKVAKAGGKGYTCYFPKPTDRRVMAAAPALRSATARGVVAYVLDNPGATGGEIAAKTGVNRATVSHHTKRLEAAGVVQLERQGNGVHAFPTDVARMVRAMLT